MLTASADPIRVGAILPLSGGVSALGKDSLDGAEVARRMINARGGVRGRTVGFVVADATTPERAAEHVHTMIEKEGVRAIVGCYGTDHTIAVSKVCESLGAVLFVATAWTAALFDHKPRFTFRANTFATPVEEAAVRFVEEVALPQLRLELGTTPVVVVHESSGYGRSCAAETLKALALRGVHASEVIGYDAHYGAGSFDSAAVAARIAQHKPTVLFASSFVDDAVALLRALEQANCRPPVVMTSSAGFGLYSLNLASSLTQGVLSANAPGDVAPAALSSAGQALRLEFLQTLKGLTGREPTGFNAMAFCGKRPANPS